MVLVVFITTVKDVIDLLSSYNSRLGTVFVADACETVCSSVVLTVRPSRRVFDLLQIWTKMLIDDPSVAPLYLSQGQS